MIDEKKKTHTFQDQKSENDRLTISGSGKLDYLKEQQAKEQADKEKAIREKLLNTPFVKEEYAKSYYRTAEKLYACKADKKEFEKIKKKILILIPIIFLMLIIETIIANVAPMYFSFGTIFAVVYLVLTTLFLISIVKTNYHMTENTLKDHIIMRYSEHKYSLIEVLPRFRFIYWLDFLFLLAGTIVDIFNLGFNLNIIRIEFLIIQIFLVAGIFIVFSVLTLALKDLYSGYRIVIAHGEIRETLPDKDTVYDFDEDTIYSQKSYFLINKELAEYNKGK